MPIKSKTTKKPIYLREIQIRYKKKRVKAGSPIGRPVKNSSMIVQLFHDLQNEAKEKLITISLDAKLKIICFEVVAIGSVSSIYSRPFEVIRSSIALNAHGIIIIHNHPSGSSNPSVEDTMFTEKIREITELGGMEFHDHIIIGDREYYSFTDAGSMDKGKTGRQKTGRKKGSG